MGTRKDGSREMEKPGDWASYCHVLDVIEQMIAALRHRVEIRGYEDRYPQISVGQICTVLKRNGEGEVAKQKQNN